MYGENQLKWDNVSDFVALTAVWTSTRNKLVPTLATFTATVQKGLKAFPLYDCKTWTLVDQKKRNYSVWFYSELWYWISYILHWFKVWYPKTVLCMLTFILFLINFQDSTGKAINRKAVVCTFSVPQIHHLHIKQPPPLSQSICI